MCNIIIDTDLSMGQFGRDVDDGLALILALNSPELSVRMVSLTYGNTALKKVEKYTNMLLNAYYSVHRDRERIIPVSGADGPLHRLKPHKIKEFVLKGKIFPSIKKMAEVIGECGSKKITLVALGPLTNLYFLATLFPEQFAALDRILIMGGKLQGWEFNFANDPEATSFILTRPPEISEKIFVAGLEVCTAQQFGKRHLSFFKKHDNKLAKYIVENIKSWLFLNRMVHGFRKGSGFYPFDPVALIPLIRPGLIQFERVKVSYHVPKILKWRFNPFQKTIVMNNEKVNGEGDWGEINWAKKIDSEKFMELLLSRLVA